MGQDVITENGKGGYIVKTVLKDRPAPGACINVFVLGSIAQDNVRPGFCCDLRPDDAAGDRWHADGVVVEVVTGPVSQMGGAFEQARRMLTQLAEQQGVKAEDFIVTSISIVVFERASMR